MYYYGARYYAAWIGRFISIDPLAEKFPQLTPYNYAGNKPITHKDLEGLQGTGDKEENSNNEPPESLITKSGKLTEPVISLINAAFSYDKEVMKESTWSDYKDSLGGEIWFFVTGYPNASVSGEDIYYESSAQNQTEWLGLIIHEESHRQDIDQVGNFNFYARYLFEGAQKNYREISTEKKAYNYGSDDYKIDLADKLVSFKNGIVLDILNDQKLTTTEKSNQLKKVGLMFRLEEIIEPGMKQVKSEITEIEKRIKTFSGASDSLKGMKVQVNYLKIMMSIVKLEKNKILNELKQL